MSTPNELHVAAWNPHVGNSPERVEGFVRDTLSWADLWAFNEMRSKYQVLEKVAKALDLWHYQEEPVPLSPVVREEGSNAALINKSFGVLAARVLVLVERWKVFSHNRVHFGRRPLVVVGRKNGVRVKTVVVHGPTNGPTGGNRTSFLEFLAMMVQIMVSTMPGTVVVIVGDWNFKREDVERWLNWPLLKLLGLKFDGHNVDWCVVRGGTVTATVGKSKRGSDHYPILYTIVFSEKLIAKAKAVLASK